MDIPHRSTFTRPVLMVDSADHVTGKTGLTLTITASKNAAAFASVSPTVTERGSGWYNIALTSKTLTISNNVLTYDADDLTFTQDAGGFSNARYAVLYLNTGSAGTSRLVAYNDLVSDRGNVNSDLVLQFPNGIFTV